MYSATPNYYSTLEVHQGASERELRTAYRRLVSIHHPDKNKGNEEAATVKFQQLNEAFETLIDPDKRRTYNQTCNQSCQSTTTPEQRGEYAPREPQWNTATASTFNFNNGEGHSYSWHRTFWGPDHVRKSETHGQRQRVQPWDAPGRVETTGWFEGQGQRRRNFPPAQQHTLYNGPPTRHYHHHHHHHPPPPPCRPTYPTAGTERYQHNYNWGQGRIPMYDLNTAWRRNGRPPPRV